MGNSNEGEVREILDAGEAYLGHLTSQSWGLSLDIGTRVLTAVRNDGFSTAVDMPKLSEFAPGERWASEFRRSWNSRNLQMFARLLDQAIEGIASEYGPEPEPAPEDRFETVIVFSSRPDIVLTPPGGVPIVEAARVYRSFRDGAAAIGGRCFTALVEAA